MESQYKCLFGVVTYRQLKWCFHLFLSQFNYILCSLGFKNTLDADDGQYCET